MKPVFQKDSAFTIAVKEQVKELIKADPRGRFAGPAEITKALALISIGAILYGLILHGDFSFATRAVLVLAFSFSTLILGLNVMHEAVHGNFTRTPWINKLMGMTFDLYGISSDLYSIKHTQFHHNYTNIHGHDGDITEAPLIRMSVNQPHWSLHRFQAFYTPILYALITITWPIYDLMRLISCKVGEHPFKRPSAAVTAKIVLLKAIHFLLGYLLPIRTLGWEQGLALILLFHFSLGVVLTLIFQVAHVHEDSRYDGGPVETDWFIHQLKTSADFSTGNPVMNFLCGGLNFQAIHHLFPNVSYRHYPEIQTIVKELCRQHGVQYLEFDDFNDALIAHFRWLNRMAKP
jgi:linoleoyl-CoA desaturase